MANEAFALSPISARATQPSEEDYDAISQAFMETSRGRWFLSEYAKRNRNADTRMVLDAVARIEESIAVQRQPPPDNRLPEALAALRIAIDEARSAADTAIDDLALEQQLAPVRKGARVIREIAWRLREIGADGRICDLIDSQVAAIEAGCGQIASLDPKIALRGVFDLIEGRIAELGDGEAASAPAEAKAAPAATVASADEPPAPVVETMQAPAAADPVEVAVASSALPPEPAVAMAEVAEAAADIVEPTAEATYIDIDVLDEVTPEDAADAHDEALLDMIALEMAAPDPSGDIDETEIDEIYAEELATAELDVVTLPPEPLQPEPELAPPAAMEASPRPAPRTEPSLGSSLLESGIVRRPTPSASDPLAPIRRMSQAEKVAFFS